MTWHSVFVMCWVFALFGRFSHKSFLFAATVQRSCIRSAKRWCPARMQMVWNTTALCDCVFWLSLLAGGSTQSTMLDLVRSSALFVCTTLLLMTPSRIVPFWVFPCCKGVFWRSGDGFLIIEGRRCAEWCRVVVPYTVRFNGESLRCKL
jgi:hypothetical protein